MFKILFRLITAAVIAWIFIQLTTFGWKPYFSIPITESVTQHETGLRLRKTVQMLSEEIGVRNYEHYDNLNKAALYVEESLKALGYVVTRQNYTFDGHVYSNIIAHSKDQDKTKEIIVVGAHYDTCFNPGADDNATGVAGLLEIAKLLKDNPQTKQIQFVAFTNEEPPFFETDLMGSRVYVKEAQKQGLKIKGAIILEMLGSYSDKLFSQRYLPLIGVFYPNQANFITVVGNFPSNSLVKQVIRGFKQGAVFPIESFVGPSSLPGVHFSDHASFWAHQYPAVMVTDTAYLRNKNYHQMTDTVETINFLRMSQVVLGLTEAIRVSISEQETIVNDISRLNPTPVSQVIEVHSVEDIQLAIEQARRKGLKISISGKRHSQGGHQSYPQGIVLDMLKFNKIISLDREEKVIRVQSGVTWEQIQNYVQPFGLAVRVMQASNIFTVGGSLGANIHGNDPHYGPIIETVKSFRFIRPDGTMVNVSREENSELFSLAIGGYGLFGVIVDVDLWLRDDIVYEMYSRVINYKEYPEFFKKDILQQKAIGLHSAKISNAPESLLEEMVITTYTETSSKGWPSDLYKLQEEKDIERNKVFFDLSRGSDWGKNIRWYWQKRLIAKVGQKENVSRNNAMRPIIKFLDYYSSKDTDILQEYFIPQEQFIGFIDGLREIVKKDAINLLSVTVRYLPENKESVLSYSKRDCFAVVLYINQKICLDEVKKAQSWTRKIVALALSLEGTYYLPYQLYPSKDQLRQAYPEFDEFQAQKRVYDPDEIFMSKFYTTYKGQGE